jgi:hypothetical protein
MQEHASRIGGAAHCAAPGRERASKNRRRKADLK